MKKTDWFILLGTVGVNIIGGCIYTNSQNLGQMFNNKLKYYSKTSDGRLTTIGYSYEDKVVLALRKAGYKVTRVKASKNGADLLINGIPYQLKCGLNGWKSATNCYDNISSECRYTDQFLLVPKGQKKMAKETIMMRKKNGLGEPLGVEESTVSRQDAIDYGFRGRKSFVEDLKDPTLIKISIVAGVVYFAIKVYIDFKKQDNIELKKSIKIISKNILGGIAIIGGFLLLNCAHRQLLRPEKPANFK